MAKKIAEAFIQLNATGLQGITGTLGRLRGAVSGAINAFGQLGLALNGLKMIGTGLLSIVSTPLQLAAEAEQIEVAMETMIGSADRAQAVLSSLYELGAKTPFEFTDLAKASRTLLSFGEDVNELLSDVEMLSNIAAGDPEKLQSLAMVFGQIQSTGRLMGQDLLQLINQGFNPLQQISERTGESMGALKKRMEQGKISFAEVKQSFVDATSVGGRFYQMNEKQSQTLAGVWSTLQDTIGQGLIKIGKVIAQSLDLKAVVVRLSGWIEQMVELFDVLSADWDNAWEIMKLSVIAKFQEMLAAIKAILAQIPNIVAQRAKGAALEVGSFLIDQTPIGQIAKAKTAMRENRLQELTDKRISGGGLTDAEKKEFAELASERHKQVEAEGAFRRKVDNLGATSFDGSAISKAMEEASAGTMSQIQGLMAENRRIRDEARDRPVEAPPVEVEPVAETPKGGFLESLMINNLTQGVAMAQAMAGLIDKIPKLMTTSMTDITSVNRSIQESMEKRRIDLQKLALEHHKRTNELIQQHIEVTKRGQSGAAFA